MKKMHKRLVIGLIVGGFLFSLCSNTQPVVAATQYNYANSYSNNTGWTSPTGAYQDGGAAARCLISNAIIDYGIADPTLEFTSGMFWKCRVEIKWRCFDTGGGGPFRLLVRGDGMHDKLYVQLYHKTSGSWTIWTLFRHYNSDWETNSLTDTSKPWSPYDLDNLVVRLKHQPSTDPDDIRVDFVRLNADNSESNINWAPYLGSDWARHPNDQDISDWADDLIEGCSTDYDKAYNIYYKTRDEWDHAAGVGDPSTYNFWIDTTILQTRKNDPDDEYKMICFQAAVILTSYLRAVGIPARIIYFKMLNPAGQHCSTEFWDGTEWLPADCDDAYDWFDKTEETKTKMIDKLKGWQDQYVSEIYIYPTIYGEETDPSNNKPLNMQTFDPDQYAWYGTFLV